MTDRGDQRQPLRRSTRNLYAAHYQNEGPAPRQGAQSPRQNAATPQQNAALQQNAAPRQNAVPRQHSGGQGAGNGGGARRRRRPPSRHTLTVLALALTAILAVALVLALWPRGAVLEGPPYVIALDAGHGGGDVGATGLIYEVELTERTVELLYDLLAADEDFKPVLCRRGDESLTPLQRAKEARRLSASVLFSVHGNAAEDAGVSGFECFPVTPGREWHAESLRLAGLVAAEMGAAGAKLRGENGVRYVYYENGEEKTFREVSDTTEYPYETFGVVEHAGCIALLAEQCFITNAQDVEAFGTEAGCAAAAACYYRAIRTFFDTL